MGSSPVMQVAVEAIEVEAFARDIPNLIPFDKSLYSLFKTKATTLPVSFATAAGGINRPSFRVPFRVQGGASITQGTGDNDSIGSGTGSQWVGFALSPVLFYAPCQITFLARIATEGRKRGLFNVQAQELKNTFDMATQGLEAIIQGDGSGTLDQIPTTATVNNNTGSGASTSSIVGLNNAFQFTDQQTIQVFPNVGGSTRGSFAVSYTDPVAQTIYSAGALPAGTTTGDYLMIAGATGAAGSSLLGLRAWQLNSNTGTIAGLNRANYPGRLSTATINLNGAAISTLTPFRAKTLLERALGKNNAARKDGVFYCGPDQTMQMASLWLNAQVTLNNYTSMSKVADMTPAEWPQTWGGMPVYEGLNALPGRIDLFAPSTWYWGELIPLQLYDFGGGMTVAPVPDIGTAGGTYKSSSLFVYTASFALANSNLRAGCYIQNAAQPSI